MEIVIVGSGGREKFIWVGLEKEGRGGGIFFYSGKGGTNRSGEKNVFKNY